MREAVGDRATIVAGVGAAGTRHTVEIAQEARKAGADAVLVVTPCCGRPPQDAVEARFRTVADACGLPVMLYDIPGRTGTRVEPATLLRLAGHPGIVAVKGCAGDLLGTQKVPAGSESAVCAGRDEHRLALIAAGAAGCVSTVANAVPRQVRAVSEAFDAGDTARAARLQQRAIECIELTRCSGLPGTVTVKVLLGALGLQAGPSVRRCGRPARRRTPVCRPRTSG